MTIKKFYTVAWNQEDKAAKYQESDIWSPTEDFAWKIHFGNSGDYGIPVDGEHDLIDSGESYEFDGDFDQWLDAVKQGLVL